MTVVAALFGVLLLTAILWDAYVTILLPRRLPSDIRVSRLVLRSLWMAWKAIGARMRVRSERELFLSFYAQLGLIALFGIWALGLMVAFAALQWAIGSHLVGPSGIAGLAADLYMSGTTFFTLGLGDVVPMSTPARILTVLEAGIGFGFLALVIAYVPVLYQFFSRREARITMLDQWGGSPPSAGLILKRAFQSGNPGLELDRLFRDWELTAAEILESHLSYPTLAFFRSQHDNQSWLASLCAVLDASALASSWVRGIDPFQPRLTFAICRHTLVDVSQVFRLRPRPEDGDRSTPERMAELRAWLEGAGVPLDSSPEADARFQELRGLYAPYLGALAEYLLMPLPGWLPPPGKDRYNWRTTAVSHTVHDGSI
jgi:Ion channel